MAWMYGPRHRSLTSLTTFSGHKGPVLDVAWAPGTVVSASRDGTARVWDMESGARALLVALCVRAAVCFYACITQWIRCSDCVLVCLCVYVCVCLVVCVCVCVCVCLCVLCSPA